MRQGTDDPIVPQKVIPLSAIAFQPVSVGGHKNIQTIALGNSSTFTFHCATTLGERHCYIWFTDVFTVAERVQVMCSRYCGSNTQSQVSALNHCAMFQFHVILKISPTVLNV